MLKTGVSGWRSHWGLLFLFVYLASIFQTYHNKHILLLKEEKKKSKTYF